MASIILLITFTLLYIMYVTGHTYVCYAYCIIECNICLVCFIVGFLSGLLIISVTSSISGTGLNGILNSNIVYIYIMYIHCTCAFCVVIDVCIYSTCT